MSHWTIVPVRGLAAGKSRLAGLLGPQDRRALNAMLLERALDAIERCDGDLSRCIVASAGADALALARQRGASPLPDARGSGLNAALEAARDAVRAKGAVSILVLAADLPDANGDALFALRDATPRGGAAIVADKRGSGTNGLLLPADCALRFAFGEGSLARHREAIRASGVKVTICNDPALCFDIDSPADYREWRSRSVHTGPSGLGKKSHGFDAAK